MSPHRIFLPLIFLLNLIGLGVGRAGDWARRGQSMQAVLLALWRRIHCPRPAVVPDRRSCYRRYAAFGVMGNRVLGLASQALRGRCYAAKKRLPDPPRGAGDSLRKPFC